jgi:hypothetical protein
MDDSFLFYLLRFEEISMLDYSIPLNFIGLLSLFDFYY